MTTAEDQVDRLLRWSQRSQVDGGFGYLRTDGSVDPGRGVECWITSRMTHVACLAVLLGREDLRPMAAHGVRALLDGPLRDAEHGGWFPSTLETGRKTAYEHAFVLLAGASAHEAGLGRELLDAALEVWQARFWDDAEGLAVDAWDAAWTTCDAYRGANGNMHGVEALLAASAALDDTGLARQALRAADRLVHREARGRAWRLPEHFDSQWRAELEHNRDRPADPFQPYGVTVGHQLEWARLLLHLGVALGEEQPAWLLEAAEALYAAGRDRGWAADGSPGFVYTLDWEDRPVVAARMHWVVAEAIAAAAVLHRVTGGERYLADQATWTQHAQERFVDPRTGCWHHELTPDGQVAEGTWSGQPDTYHAVQALLLTTAPLAPSTAAAVRAAAS